MASRVFLEGGCAHDIDGGVRPMDITRALRAFRDEYFFPEDDEYRSMTAVADRIEAAHDKALIEMRNRAIDQAREEMEMDGWVQPPKDADGEYIHVGDVMESGDGGVFVVSSVDYGRHSSCGDGEFWMLWSEDADFYERADECHHHAPTVEDILREMLDKWGEMPSNMTNEAIVAEYAAKLRLAGGDR